MHNLRATLVGAQGYERLSLSKHVVGPSIALHAVPGYRALPTQCLPSRLIQLHFPQISPILNGGVYRIANQNLYLWYEYICFAFAVDWV